MKQLTHDKQVSGSSTLVGSLFCRDLQENSVVQRGFDAKPEAYLLQPGEEAHLVQ
jgi:hypothetical protein